MKPGIYLGFDYGKKHIGVAVGNQETRIAHALATVTSRNDQPDWEHITRLLQEWQPCALVVGLPLNMDDSENTMTQAAKKFGNRLQGRYNLPVHMVDERLTSVAAKDTLLQAGIPYPRRLSKIDKLAAQALLQAFLDERETPHAPNDH